MMRTEVYKFSHLFIPPILPHHRFIISPFYLHAILKDTYNPRLYRMKNKISLIDQRINFLKNNFKLEYYSNYAIKVALFKVFFLL